MWRRPPSRPGGTWESFVTNKESRATGATAGRRDEFCAAVHTDNKDGPSLGLSSRGLGPWKAALPYACCINFQILLLCIVNNHTVRCRPAGDQSGLRPEPILKNYRLGVYPEQAPPGHEGGVCVAKALSRVASQPGRPGGPAPDLLRGAVCARVGPHPGRGHMDRGDFSVRRALPMAMLFPEHAG